VVGGFGFALDPDQFAVAYEEAFAATEPWTEQFDAKGFDDFPIGVGDQPEWKFVLLVERLLVSGLVHADADDGDAFVG